MHATTAAPRPIFESGASDTLAIIAVQERPLPLPAGPLPSFRRPLIPAARCRRLLALGAPPRGRLLLRRCRRRRLVASVELSKVEEKPARRRGRPRKGE